MSSARTKVPASSMGSSENSRFGGSRGGVATLAALEVERAPPVFAGTLQSEGPQKRVGDLGTGGPLALDPQAVGPSHACPERAQREPHEQPRQCQVENPPQGPRELGHVVGARNCFGRRVGRLRRLVLGGRRAGRARTVAGARRGARGREVSAHDAPALPRGGRAAAGKAPAGGAAARPAWSKPSVPQGANGLAEPATERARADSSRTRAASIKGVGSGAAAASSRRARARASKAGRDRQFRREQASRRTSGVARRTQFAVAQRLVGVALGPLWPEVVGSSPTAPDDPET